jgi:hypothetical protein
MREATASVAPARRALRGRGRRIQDHVRQPVQPDQLDEPLDLGLGPAQAQVPAGLAQTLGHHGEVDHQRGVGEDQLVEVDEDRVIRVQSPGHRTTSQALSGPVFVSHTADHRRVFAVGDDGGSNLS